MNTTHPVVRSQRTIADLILTNDPHVYPDDLGTRDHVVVDATPFVDH